MFYLLILFSFIEVSQISVSNVQANAKLAVIIVHERRTEETFKLVANGNSATTTCKTYLTLPKATLRPLLTTIHSFVKLDSSASSVQIYRSRTPCPRKFLAQGPFCITQDRAGYYEVALGEGELRYWLSDGLSLN